MWSIIIIIFKVLSKDFKDGILATNIWPKSENLGTWFEITFVRFYICNLIWLEIFESKPVTCDHWSLCSNSNPNMDFSIYFWTFFNSTNLLKRRSMFYNFTQKYPTKSDQICKKHEKLFWKQSKSAFSKFHLNT